MTREEFNDWFDRHAEYFPGVRTWLDKLDPRHARGVTDIWFQHIQSCDQADCLAASQRLYDAGGRAPVYERHPQAVKDLVYRIKLERVAQQVQPQFIDGEQVYQCPQCQDDGRLICWSKKSMEAAHDGTLGEPFTVYRCAVACDCQAGERHAKYLARFDPQKWLIWGLAPPGEELERLRQFVRTIGAPTEEVAS